jgi:hypothetical protein
MAASEVHGSLLDQADYLLGETYHIAAAAVAGAVLEDHLVKLTAKHGVTWDGTYHTISNLNHALKKAGVYGSKVWGQVKNLQATRDLVDHHEFGDKSEVNPQEVALMLKGVRLFIEQHPV